MSGDATNWDEDAYRESILKERELRTRTIFRTVWAPSQSPNPDAIVVASSDGSLASYSISSCISKLVSLCFFAVPHFDRISIELIQEIYLFIYIFIFFGGCSNLVLTIRGLNSKYAWPHILQWLKSSISAYI